MQNFAEVLRKAERMQVVQLAVASREFYRNVNTPAELVRAVS